MFRSLAVARVTSQAQASVIPHREGVVPAQAAVRELLDAAPCPISDVAGKGVDIQVRILITVFVSDPCYANFLSGFITVVGDGGIPGIGDLLQLAGQVVFVSERERSCKSTNIKQPSLYFQATELIIRIIHAPRRVIHPDAVTCFVVAESDTG